MSNRFISAFMQGNKTAKLQFVLVVLALVAAVLIATFMRFEPADVKVSGSAKNKIFVETVTVFPRATRVKTQTTAVVQAEVPVQIIPEVSGRVAAKAANFKAGGAFEAGEVLFELEVADYLNAKAQAQAALANAKTNRALMQAEAGAALAEWEAINPGIAPNPLVSKVPQLAQAKAAVDAAQADLEQAELNIRRTKFRFPFAGKVTDLSLTAGQYVRAGSVYGAVYSAQNVELKIPLQRSRAAYYPVGASTVQLTTDQGSARATISRISASLDPATRLVDLFAPLNSAQQAALDVLPGSFITAVVTGEQIPSAYLIPARAFYNGLEFWTVISGQPVIAAQTENAKLSATESEPELRLLKRKLKIVSKTEEFFTVVDPDAPAEEPMRVVLNQIFGAEDGMTAETANKQ